VKAVARGKLTRLFRWPVKSMRGEEIESAWVASHGLAGDRAYALVDGDRDGVRRRLSARQVPDILEWSAAYPDDSDDAIDSADPPVPLVTAPDGRRFNLDDPELPAALASDLPRSVALRRAPSGEQDRPRTLLVTHEATRRAVAQELGRPLELRRFRPNLHLELDAEPFAEQGWTGRRIEVGEATLRIREPCERCAVPAREPDHPRQRWHGLLRWLAAEHEGAFGTIVTVERAGRVRRGDRVVVR
jgi:uncharacterized protein YcbX